MNESLGLGGVRSPIDYRDAIAASGVKLPTDVKLPATYQLQLDRVLMQNKIPACVSHDIVDAIKLHWFKKTGNWVDFSPRFLDILSAEADIPLNGGRRPRTVLRVAFNKGCCTTATLPNDTTLPIAEYRDPKAITQAALDEAAKYKIPGYINVPIDLQKTRAAIYFYGLVSTLFEIGDSMWLPSWSPADIDPLRTPTKIIGNHQMGQKGWTAMTMNTIRNEWSDAWANRGENEIDYTPWEPFLVEQWAIAEIPEDVTSYLKALPAPSDFHFSWQNNLAIGDHNDDVKFLQIALMILGFLAPVDPSALGYYGPKTSKAVGRYQQAHMIPQAPNNVGPMTRNALNAQFSV